MKDIGKQALVETAGGLVFEEEMHSLRAEEDCETAFIQQIANIQKVGNKLAMTESFDDLCRLGVILARKYLGFDRISFWFVTNSPLEVRGSFAVDENGNIRDERQQVLNPPQDSLMGQILSSQQDLIHETGTTLHDETGKVLGKGDHLIAPLLDGRRIVGCVSAENFHSQTNVFHKRKHIINLFSSTMGHLAFRKRAEDELKAYRDQVFQTQRVEFVGHMANGIAHDLSNLLAPILLYTEMARNLSPSGHPINEYLGEVISATEKANEFSMNLLNFSKRKKLDVKTFDLNDLLRNFEKILRQLLLQTNISFEMDLSDEGLVIHADSAQIEQVVMNLVVNAREAMPDGGTLDIITQRVDLDKELSLQTDSLRSGSYALIKVGDNGAGMSESLVDKIFEPFFSEKSDRQGAGLGLFTVRSIVRNYGGGIDVDSELGRGTLFSIYLPIATV